MQELAPSFKENQDRPERALRPLFFREFIGQKELVDNLSTFVRAAKKRNEPLDHVLLSGPPGLGKTSLAHLLANELGVQCHTTSGASIARTGELAALLTNLKPHDVLFVDEIHRLGRHIEEILYPALEDKKLDLMVGEGPAARSVRLQLAPFTLVGATTRQGVLSRPLRDRFGILAQVNFYEDEALALIIANAASRLELPLAEDAALFLAARARGTPRIALRLLRRLQDFAVVQSVVTCDVAFIQTCLAALGVDHIGLDTLDCKYLKAIYHQFSGGPVGIDTLAAALFEERTTLEDVVEPFLIQRGFLKRTARGRVLGAAAIEHFNWVLNNSAKDSADKEDQAEEGALLQKKVEG